MLTPTVGFSPASIPETIGATYTGLKGSMDNERTALKTNLRTMAVDPTEGVNYEYYGILWTLVDGPNLPGSSSYPVKLTGANTMNPVLSDVMDGHYEFKVYAIRMNGADDYCSSETTVNVDIHIPTMAALEAKYQGIGDWTINRTAMCQDNIEMQWMTATGITYTPNSQLPSGSSLEPGEIAGIPEGKEYSIFRIVSDKKSSSSSTESSNTDNTDTDDTDDTDDTEATASGSDIVFTQKSYTAGAPGIRGYQVSNLPYNGTNFELLNCINFTDPSGNARKCVTSDTITIFNNSVYADADVRIDPDKSKEGYHWVKQEVNICDDKYELVGNDPKGLDGNLSIEQYATHGMWGFDDKDFKGYYTGDKHPSIENTTLYKTNVTDLWPSDNHQRANALIWCVYKSIIPPTCDTDGDYCDTHSVPPNQYSPLLAYCAYGKEFYDFYESDPSTHQIYWYAKKTSDESVDYSESNRYYQISYTLCGVKRYGFVKATYTAADCSAVDGETVLSANYVVNKNDVGAALCVNRADLLDNDELKQIEGFYANSVYETATPCDANVLDYKNKKTSNCNKFYMMEDIENALTSEIAYKMKLWNLMSYLKTSEGNLFEGRANYNYYASINDGVDTVYLWSDRQTQGRPNGAIYYECIDANGTKTDPKLSFNSNGSGKDGYWQHTYFKGADLLYAESTEARNKLSQYTWQENGQTCYPLQFDSGWNRDNPQGFGVNTKYSTFSQAFSTYDTWKQCVLTDYNVRQNKYPGCGLCSGTYHVFFVTSALFGYGIPAPIPISFLKADDNGVRAVFYDNEPTGVSNTKTGTANNYTTNNCNNVTCFASLKGDSIAITGTKPLLYDVPDMPGYDHAYHVSGWRWDDDAIAKFGADLEKEIASTSKSQGVQIVSSVTNIDELKEEADNSDKHYWCVARDTVFIYDNRFSIEDMKPNFVVCDEEAELKGEEPGVAAEANASGVWTVRTNAQSVTIASPSQYVTKVSGLPSGETQFNWHLTRWGCEADSNIYVYRNIVEAKGGNDIYTCDDFAQLEGVDPQSPSVGTWTRTQGAATSIKFGDAVSTPDDDKTETSNKSDAWVFGLIQGENPLTWTVENPMPPTVTTTTTTENEDGTTTTTTSKSLGKINGHTYYTQESCPKEDGVIVHDLQPDDAVIQTGTEVTSP